MTVVRTRACSSSSGANTQDFVRGDYDLSTNVFPSLDGSGSAGAIRAGDKWYGTGSGILDGIEVGSGVTLEAKINNPGLTIADWRIYY